MKRISKFLALVLRHNPAAAGLSLDDEGWADVEAVLASIRRRFGDFDRFDLEELVRTNDKKRYAFDESGTRIRANQGASRSTWGFSRLNPRVCSTTAPAIAFCRPS